MVTQQHSAGFVSLVGLLFLCLTACRQRTPSNPIVERFQSVVETLPQAKLPLRLNMTPREDPDLGPYFTDSLFIRHFLDSTFFHTDAGDRTFGFHRGVRLFTCEQYIAVLFPFNTGISAEYHLHTFKPNGTPISRLELPGTFMEEFTYEVDIDTAQSITVVSRRIDEQDNAAKQRWQPVIRQQYSIRPDGSIVTLHAASASDWAGVWRWVDDRYALTATLDIKNQDAETFAFQIDFVSGAYGVARQLSGTAARIGDIAYSNINDPCRVVFHLHSGREMRVFHLYAEDCSQTAGADLGGVFFRALYDRKLAEVSEKANAPCFVYAIETANGAPFDLPVGIRPGLDCPVMLGNSPDRRYLCFREDNGAIQLLDFKTNKVQLLADHLPRELHGASYPLWTADSKQLAFALVQQSDFSQETRLFRFAVDDGKIIDSKSADVAVPYTCANNCMVVEGVSFWFLPDGSVAYLTRGKEHVIGRF
ncbi:MAG: hypothetical protein IPH12_03680 [Saprospirales bacterium]|jgi:hypothetical protein|nr:hypothetical protein [Saprospirales bacterium]MBK8922410.1 hypothetical protein [Saprospirales bacterium]